MQEKEVIWVRKGPVRVLRPKGSGEVTYARKVPWNGISAWVRKMHSSGGA